MKLRLFVVFVLSLMLTQREGHAIALRPTDGVQTIGEITATGHAMVTMKPDIAYINVGVVTQSRDQAVAVQINATNTANVITALKRGGIDDKDIQTQYYGLQPQYDYNTSPALLTGYQVTNQFRISVHNLKQVGDFIDITSKAGGNQVDSVTFDLADRTAAEQNVLCLAIRNAVVKAKAMAGAAGVDLGRLLSLSEGSAPVERPILERTYAIAAAAAPAATPIQTQQLGVSADAVMVYAIGL